MWIASETSTSTTTLKPATVLGAEHSAVGDIQRRCRRWVGPRSAETPLSASDAFEAFDPIACGQQDPRRPYPGPARNIWTMVEDFMRFVLTALWGVTVVAVSVLGYLAY